MDHHSAIETEEKKKHNTIFDDVFRTMVQKMPDLLIPLINEVFGTKYAEDVGFEQLRNEQITPDGKIVTDSILKIESKIYHIECQSNSDSTMVLRMFEYDFSIALEDAYADSKYVEINFPDSCVLYLRSNRSTPSSLKIKVNFSNGESGIYESKVIKAQDYTSNEIFEKKLLMLLPYYIMRYERDYEVIENNQEQLKIFLEEYRSINNELADALLPEDKSALYSNLCGLIAKIAEHMLEKQQLMKKGVLDIMGGQILELNTERWKREGREEGRAEGREKELCDLVADELLTPQKAAERLGMTIEEFKAKAKELGILI